MSSAGPSTGSSEANETEWVSARDAVQRIMRATDQAAKEALGSIIAYAKTGQVKARALAVTKQWYREGYGPGRREETGCAAVPVCFWGEFTEKGLWKRFNWQSGVFEARGFDGGQQLEMALTGVQFDGRGLDLLDPPRSPRQAPISATSKVKTGRPRGDWWEDLIIEIFAKIHWGDLKPTRQSHVEEAMHEWLTARGIPAAVSTVRLRARKLWEAVNRADV